MNVVISGIGMISSNANSIDDFADSCFNGKLGFKECHSFDTNGLSTPLFGEIYDLNKYNNRLLSLMTLSANDFFNHTNITNDEIYNFKNKCKMFLGTLTFEPNSFCNHSLNKQININSDELLGITNYQKYAKSLFNVQGDITIVSSSCSSSTAAIGIAMDYIRNGLCQMAIIGCSDALSKNTAYGFNSLHSLTKNICNPFDESRDGINIGECGTWLLLETKENAIKHNRKIYCEVVGYALNNDAYHITRPDITGNSAYNVMNNALLDAHITSECIDYINLHGTGTQLNDTMEIKAIEKLFKHNVYISSTKALIGHCMGASGGIELISTILSMNHHKYIPMPLLNQKIKMNDNLLMSNKTCDIDIKYALSNSFAFSGNNACIVIKKVGDDI